MEVKYPDKAALIVDKVLRFRQYRYNAVGRHLLYLDLDGFLHIYLRHVEELSTSGLYPERSKFQLAEKDVEIAISHVMDALNDEYQIFREDNPDRQFRKYSDQAYYYNVLPVLHSGEQIYHISPNTFSTINRTNLPQLTEFSRHFFGTLKYKC